MSVAASIMAVSLRVGSVETLCAGFGKNWFSVSPRRLVFTASVASAAGLLCRKRVGVCGRRGLKISCEGEAAAVVDRVESLNLSAEGNVGQLSCVMKFGGSSLASAERMREVAELILKFPEERPVIVLSAMGKTTNKLLQVHVSNICCLCCFFSPMLVTLLMSLCKYMI